METKSITITYDHADAIMDVNAALATVQTLIEEGGIFGYSQEAAEKELGVAYLMGRYEQIQTLLLSIERQLGRASQILTNDIY